MTINVRRSATDLEVSVPQIFSEKNISTVSAADGYSIINTSDPHFFKNFEAVGISCTDARFNRSESGGSGFIERINSLSFRFSNDIASTPVPALTGSASVSISSSVTSRRREGNLVTLQLSGTHRFANGDIIAVTGLNSAWNGTFSITDAAPGGDNTRIRYSQTGPDVLNFVADSGSVSANIVGFITNKQMLSNVANLTLSSNAGRMQIGDTVNINIDDPWFSGPNGSGTYTISNRTSSVISYSTAVSLRSVIGTAIGWTLALTVNVRANNTDNIVYPEFPLPGAATLTFPDPLVIGSQFSVSQSGSLAWRYRTDSLSYQWVRGTSSSGPWTNISGATSSTYNLTSSDGGFWINCSVTATNTKGSVTNLATNPQFFTTPLPAPTGLNTSDLTNTTVTLGWSSVTNATIYEYSVSTSTTFTTWTSVGNSTSVNITGLTHNTQYYFSVRARRNVNDVAGIAAAAAGFVTLVGPPTITASVGITTAANFGNVVLNNTVAGGGGFAVAYSNYRVEYAVSTNNGQTWGGWIFLENYSTLNFNPIVTTLTKNQSYKFRSVASNSGGNPIGVYSAETSAVVPFGPPGTPTGVSVTYGADGTTLTLNWSTTVTTNGAPVVGWAVSRTPSPTNYADWVRYTTASQSTHTFGSGASPLTPNTSYSLRVKAIVGTINQSGSAPTPFDIATDFSTNADLQTVTTAAVPSQPNAPTASTTSTTGITITWSAPANNRSAITAYHLQRSTNGTTWPADTTFNTFSASTTSFTATGVDRNTNYFYRIRAVNGVGNGPWSPASNAGIRVGLVPSLSLGTSVSDGFFVNHLNIDNTNFTYTATTSNVNATSATPNTNPFKVTLARSVVTSGSLGISNSPTGNPIPRLATVTVGEGGTSASVTNPSSTVTVTAIFTPNPSPTDGSSTSPSGTGSALTVTKSYQWQKSSTSGGTYTNISGATSASYVTTVSDRSQWLRCRIIYSATGATSDTLFSTVKQCAA